MTREDDNREISSNGSAAFLKISGLILTGGFILLLTTNFLNIKRDFRQPVGGDAAKLDGQAIKHPEDIIFKKTTESPTANPSEKHNDDDVDQTYKRRGQPMSDENRQSMIDKWGSWTLIDDKDRPGENFYTKYPNRDVPRSEFPANAWQIDMDYLSKFLPESLAIIQRAQEAVLAEYGRTEGDWDERKKMFEVTAFEKLPSVKELGEKKPNMDSPVQKGGWTTKKSWEGLKRRVLHAVMTGDSFVFAMGGHSAAAGHGNHFQQSYTLQVQWILEAVFARLGVKHEARNFGNGGLGTLHNGLAAGSIYGPDVDMLMWDSGMTENRDLKAIDLFHRQGLLGGIKVPALWSYADTTIKFLNEEADVDVGFPGSGYYGIKEAESAGQIKNMTWAMQYVKCSKGVQSLCRQNEYMGTCWIDREDFTPSWNQKKEPGGRVKWHPGNRIHQVAGRVIAFTILQALKEVMTTWNDADGFELADDSWHITNYYESMRRKVVALSGEGRCKNLQEMNLSFACKYPMKARTEFTPRAFPSSSNIRSLMHSKMRSEINRAGKNMYNPPDVFNPNLHPPPGEIDVLSIVEAGVDFKPISKPDYSSFYSVPSHSKSTLLEPGKGYELVTRDGDEHCNGSVDSFCNRGTSNECLLYGHNNGRGGLLFHGYSGWLVLNIPDLKHGYIVIKLESWHAESIEKTEGWKSINGVDGDSDSSSRGLKDVPDYCPNFEFQYSIDGKVTTLNLEQWKEKLHQVQRVVETVTLLADPTFTDGGVEKQVELGIRIRGCDARKVFKLSHVYWS